MLVILFSIFFELFVTLNMFLEKKKRFNKFHSRACVICHYKTNIPSFLIWRKTFNIKRPSSYSVLYSKNLPEWPFLKYNIIFASSFLSNLSAGPVLQEACTMCWFSYRKWFNLRMLVNWYSPKVLTLKNVVLLIRGMFYSLQINWTISTVSLSDSPK